RVVVLAPVSYAHAYRRRRLAAGVSGVWSSGVRTPGRAVFVGADPCKLPRCPGRPGSRAERGRKSRRAEVADLSVFDRRHPYFARLDSSWAAIAGGRT